MIPKKLHRALILLTVVGVSHGYSFSSVPYYDHGSGASQLQYQPRALHYFQQNDINRPVVYPQLGMSPEYHDLVYKYITDFAGNQEPPQAKVKDPYHLDQQTDKEEQSQAPAGKPGMNDYLLPSDFILLRKPLVSSQLDAIRMQKKSPKETPLTNPPIGGVLSNYVLLRNRPDYQTFIPFSLGSDSPQVSKRQIVEDADDTVVINAENSQSSVKMNESEDSRDQGMNENGEEEGEEEEEEQPAIAQSKPAAIALAGPGGVAQASPVGTALVGPGGLAVAAPSGTAVAGPAGQSVVSPSADDKAKIVQKKIKEVWN